MNYGMSMMRNNGIIGLCLAVALLSSGCAKRVGRSDARERMLPLVVKAEKKCLEGEFDRAVEWYEKALMARPAAARVHLDLALVQHYHTKDLIGAVYHYRRYIALRPDTEKDAMIDDQIRLAMQQLDARGVGLEEKSLDRLVALEKENTGLRLEAEKLSAELKKAKQKLAAVERTRVAVDSPAPPRRRTPPRVRPKTYRACSASRELGSSRTWARCSSVNCFICSSICANIAAICCFAALTCCSRRFTVASSMTM